jgi:hypothetical protein
LNLYKVQIIQLYHYKSKMNPNCIASNFSVQQVSKHHYLIRGDERIKDYMNFCDVKWSNSYQGWIVHEDDEVDLVQMHMEVMDLAKEQKARADKKTKKSSKKPAKKQIKTSKDSKKKLIVTSDEDSEDEQPKKKISKKGDLYERFKRGEDISDDEDDEYVPSSEPSTETITEESDLEEEEDSEYEEEESEEDTEDEDSEDEDSEEEEEYETDPKRKKEFQFYKKGILAFGKMTDRLQEKLEANWNKTLHGWIIRMSYLEKLKKNGWTEIDNEEPKQKQHKQKEEKRVKEKVIDDTKTVVNTPKVTKKSKVEEENTFEKYIFSLLVKGNLTLEQLTQLQGIYHPTLKGFLVSFDCRDKLINMGFRDKNPDTQTVEANTTETKEKDVVKIDFTQGEQLKA